MLSITIVLIKYHQQLLPKKEKKILDKESTSQSDFKAFKKLVTIRTFHITMKQYITDPTINPSSIL